MINLVHPFQDAGTLGILSGNWRAAIPGGYMEAPFDVFEPLFERMFVKVVGARADIDEVMACLKCISVNVPLPERPAHRVQAAEEVCVCVLCVYSPSPLFSFWIGFFKNLWWLLFSGLQ
jgi:hypothetical protein